MAEIAVFDWIAFAAIGWVVSYSQIHPQTICQPLQVKIEDMMPSVVAASAVTQKQHRLGTAVEAIAVAMPPSGNALDGKDADDRQSSGLKSTSQAGHFFKLFVAVGAFAQ